MFFLLLLVIAIFGGLLLAVESGSINIETLSGWPIAVAVIGVLIILYLATLHGGDGERRFGRLLIVVAPLRSLGVGVQILRTNPPALIANFLRPQALGNEPDALARNAPASVRIRRVADGAFVANSEVNGEAIPMLIDSGAATVVLRQSDAEKAGIDISNLDVRYAAQNRKWHELSWRCSLEIRARRSAHNRRRRSPRCKAGNS